MSNAKKDIERIMETVEKIGRETTNVSNYIMGEIMANTYMVERGKPASCIPVKVRDIDMVEKKVRDVCGIKTYCEILSEKWVTMWIYKYPHILEIIRSTKDNPKTTFDHWVLGKLFGYDEDSIAKFLKYEYERS